MADKRVGVARGQFRVDTSQVQNAGQVIVRTSRGMGEAMRQAGAAVGRFEQGATSSLGRIAASFKQAQANAQSFARSDLGVIQKGLQGAATSAASLVTTLGAGGIVRSGVGAAQQINRINALMVTFSGSTEKANARLSQLRQIADNTGQSFLDVANGAIAILPAVGRNNVELGKTLSLVQRLALLDPAQGAEGAAYAIREALSGEARSLAARFELPRKQVQDVIRNAQGDPQRIIEGLDELVNSLGLTEEKFNELNKSGINAFSRLRGTVAEATATAFAPFLNDVLVPLADRFTGLVRSLNETNPGLLTLAGGLTIVTAGVGPLLLILSQTITAFKTLRAVASVPIVAKISGLAGKAGVLGAAGFVGVQGGLATARALGGEVVRNEGLRGSLNNALKSAGSDTGDLEKIGKGADAATVIGDRFKQVLVIAASVLLDGVKIIGTGLVGGANVVKQGAELIFSVFKLGASFLNEGFGRLVQIVGAAVLSIGRLVAKLDGDAGANIQQAGIDLFQQGSDRVNQALTDRAEAASRLARGLDFNETLDAVDAFTAGIDSAKQTILGGLVGVLFPVEQAAQGAAGALGELEEPANDIAAAFERNQEAIEETAQKIADLNREFEEESRKIAESRAIEAERSRFDEALKSGRENRDQRRADARQDEDFYRGRSRRIADFNRELKDAEAEGLRQRYELIADFNRDEQRRAEDHGRRLAEIERDTQNAVQDAAASLDAKGVFQALRAGAQKAEDANLDFNTETKRRQEDLQQQVADLNASLAQQRNQRIAAFQQQLADELAQRELQRARQAEDRAIREKDEAEDRKIRQQRQAEDYARQDRDRRAALQRQISDQIAALAATTGIQQNMLNVVVTGLAAAGGKVANFVNYVNSQLARLGGGSSSSKAPSNNGRVGLSARGFASGGRPPLNTPVRVNELGMESARFNNGMMALFTQPAQIIPARQTQQLLAGGGDGRSISIGDINTNLTGTVLDRDEVDGLMRSLIWNLLDKVQRTQ